MWQLTMLPISQKHILRFAANDNDIYESNYNESEDYENLGNIFQNADIIKNDRDEPLMLRSHKNCGTNPMNLVTSSDSAAAHTNKTFQKAYNGAMSCSSSV